MDATRLEQRMVDDLLLAFEGFHFHGHVLGQSVQRTELRGRLLVDCLKLPEGS